MKVEELMTPDPLTCLESASLERAAQLMWEHDVGAVCVVDDAGALAGIITDRDALMGAYTQGRRLAEVSVYSAMSRNLQTCAPSESVGLAEERMRRFQLRRLPVLQQGHVVGIISLNDIAIAAGDHRSSMTGLVKLDGVAVTLARISEHRRRSQSQAAIEAE